MNSRLFPSALLLAGLVLPASANFSVEPGADLIFHVNAAALNKSAMYAEFSKNNEDPEMDKKMMDATGLKKEDILSASASLVLDGLDFSAGDIQEKVFTQPGVMQVVLAKAVTTEQLKSGILVMGEQNNTSGSPLKADVAGDLVKVSSGEEGSHPLYATTGADGKLVFLGFSEKNVRAAQARSKSGAAIPLPAEFKGVLDPNSHMSVALILPAQVREQLAAQFNAMRQNPEMAMQAGMLAPFAGLSSLSFAAKFNDQDMDIGAALDLGDAQSAAAANQTLSMITMMAAAQLGPIGQKIRLAPEGSAIKLKMNLTKADLEAAAAKAMQGAAGAAQGLESAPLAP